MSIELKNIKNELINARGSSADLDARIDAIESRLTIIETYAHYVDRGDPSAYDFAVGDLTTDATWNDLDLSSIVPATAAFVHFRVHVRSDSVTSHFSFRKNGNTNAINSAPVKVQVADLSIHNSDVIVGCDSDQVVEYYATDTTWAALDISVRGWWI